MVLLPLDQFAERVNQVIPVLMRKVFNKQGNELYKGKITMPQFIILCYLEKHGAAMMSELAHAMEVTTAAMTGNIARLVKAGYAARRYDPKDRRIVRVQLTPKGEKSVRRINDGRRQVIVDIFGKISGHERENYLKILEHIHEILSVQQAE